MIEKRIFSFAASIIKFFIIYLFFLNANATTVNKKYYHEERGILSIMYHRFGEHKYPSTNIKIDVFPSEWDGNNTRVIGPRKRELNLQLENIRISILRKYHELSKTNVHLTGKSIVIY